MHARITAVIGVFWIAACSQSGLTTGDAGGAPDATNGGACTACVMDSDCGGGVCAQLGGDSYCASTCASTQDCVGDQQCVSVSTVAGEQAQLCVEAANTTCGLTHPQTDGGSATCPGFADPTTSAGCTSCKQFQTNCQANGCYGGWFCNTSTLKCQQPPQSCASTSDGGLPDPFDGGVTSNIGPSGGTESSLYFAIVGDTRPATEDDTKAYPSAIISTIFSDITALKTVPPFVVSTGDYQFSNPSGTESASQLGLYLAAKGSYPGVQFPAMGNHECTGYTTSNCGAGSADGMTNNYTSFLSLLLGPIKQTLPYYVINIAANDSSWTAKLVFVAANAWDSTQAAWFDAALSVSTTYTFIVRHESASANTAPGVTPSEAIMTKYPYTLAIVGHSHEYYHSKNSREVVIGNGGAPLATSQNYGYGLVEQRSDGSITVDMIDYQTSASDVSFHFAINADGSAAK